MSLKLYRQNAADIDQQIAANAQAALEVSRDIRALNEKVTVKEKRAMTDEEKAQLTTLNDRQATLAEFRTSLLKEKASNAELLVAAEAANEAERRAEPAKADSDVEAGKKAAGDAGIQMGEDRTTKAPGYFGLQLHAVRKAALFMKGGDSLTSQDLALLKPMQAAATGANTDVPSEGGFLVGTQRSGSIIQRAYETGEILQRVKPMPIGAGFNGAKLPAIDETSRADSSRFGGIVSGWLGQGNTLTSGKPKFREIDLKLRKVGAFVYSTDEMNVDSVLFEGWVNRYLPLELQFRTEDAIVNGVGSNQPLGLMNSPSVITVTRSTASHILSDDLRAMVNRMWAPLWGRAAFFVDQSTLGEFDQLGIAQGTGAWADPSYKAAGSMPGQKYATYKNIPIIPVEYCAALGTSGDIILVNLDEYILIDKGGVEQAVSLHVAFLTDEAVYRFMYRVDGQLTWNSALTPKSGGATLGCVVVLS